MRGTMPLGRLLLFALLALLVWPRILAAGDEASAPARPSGTRDMLALFGVDETARVAWIDGKPCGDHDPQLLLSVLYGVRRFELVDIERWTHRDVTWQQLLAQPDRYRGEFVSLSGRLLSVEPIAVPAGLAARFELRSYYRASIEWGEPARRATVFSLEVPRAWLEEDPTTLAGDAVRLDGLFLCHQGSDPGAPDPVFVTQRIGWQRDSMLGRLGMDVGLFDTIENRQPLTRSDREVFYQLLAACGRADERELSAATAGPATSVAPLFNDADRQHGRLVALEGTARRVVPIRIEEPDLRERFGLDHYYEMEVFTDDSQGNPLVFCLLELPERFPQGDRLAERVRVPAFFFKTWAYRPAGGEEKRMQLAPLLVGRSAHWLRPADRSRSTSLGLIVGGLFVAGLAGVWLAIWWAGQTDRRATAKLRSRRLAESLSADLEKADQSGSDNRSEPTAG
ncbi:MAG: hypothetical protein KF708_13340 [Pirellulales bacterium]|nr:hypothetical protein [Pirellulales bacterium]